MAQTFYKNGIILPLVSEKSAQALLIEEDKILYCGEEKAAEKMVSNDCSIVDLQGHTLMPSFIDAHSHICAFSHTLSLVSLQKATSFSDVAAAISAYIAEHHIPEGTWISGFGYDHNTLSEHAHPTKELLDRAAPHNPVILAHASGHMGVLNSAALHALNITAQTPAPSGGKIGKDSDGHLTGYLEETAFMSMSAHIPAPSLSQQIADFLKAENQYFQYGITTIQEGLMKQAEFDLLTTMASQNKITADIVGYVDEKNCAHLLKDHPEYRTYQNHFKIGGYKIFLDGSPQGKTAYIREPYEGEKDGYRGYPVYTDSEITHLIDTALCSHAQLLAHCNGDSAAQQYIDALQLYPTEAIQAMRPVMIHAQLLRRDQLESVKHCGIIPSYFIAHTYHWGDTHLQNLGKGRADYISPAHSTLKKGIPFTFHQDTPVLLPDMLETIWCAVTRKTKSGKLLAQSECITPYQALCAVTKNAAYAYFEEKEKGTLEPGKLADLILLDANPLTVPVDDIKNITILQTIKSGHTVYKA